MLGLRPLVRDDVLGRLAGPGREGRDDRWRRELSYSNDHDESLAPCEQQNMQSFMFTSALARCCLMLFEPEESTYIVASRLTHHQDRTSNSQWVEFEWFHAHPIWDFFGVFHGWHVKVER